MAYKKNEIGLLLSLDVDEAKRRILAAFDGCTQDEAAEKLGVHRTTLVRWVRQLGLSRKRLRIKMGRSRKVA
jgi:excisionase family DNA binding protein